jgi:uncharacterized protein (PEP-CTERM system associated)
MPMTQPRPEAIHQPRHCGQRFVGRLTANKALALLVLPLLGDAVWAQSATPSAPPRGLVITPRVSVSETYTDNNLLSNTTRDSALITTLTPGVSISARGGAVTGTLDYSLSGIAYLKSNQPDRLQQNLNAQGHADFVPQVFFVDGVATISQENRSALGTQSVDPNLGYANRVETQTVTLAPVLRGHLGHFANLELRGGVTGTNVMHTAVGDSHVVNASARMDGLNEGQLRWWGLLSTSKVHFKTNAASNDDTQAMLGLRYQPDVDFYLTASGGRERSNYLTGADVDSVLYGFSGAWTPTVRTVLDLDWQHHAYGDSHTLKFEHRMARSVWRLSDSQSVAQASKISPQDLGSNFDLLFLQYSAIEPDPVKRAALVRSILANLGLNPNAQITIGLLSNVPVLSRSRQASFALEGVRTTVTASLNQLTSRQIGANAQTAGDLSNFSLINQRGFSLNAAHKLTPQSSLSASYVQSWNTGAGGVVLASESSVLHSLTATWTNRLNPNSTASLMVRHSEEGGANPYRESAMVATFVQTF